MEKEFIPIQVDFNKNKALVKRFGVKWTPTIIIFDADGDEHHRFIGFLPPEDFIAQLILGKGKAEFDQDHFEQAIQCFQEILVRFPKADAAPEAQYFLGVARYKGLCNTGADRVRARTGWDRRRPGLSAGRAGCKIGAP